MKGDLGTDRKEGALREKEKGVKGKRVRKEKNNSTRSVSPNLNEPAANFPRETLADPVFPFFLYLLSSFLL